MKNNNGILTPVRYASRTDTDMLYSEIEKRCKNIFYAEEGVAARDIMRRACEAIGPNNIYYLMALVVRDRIESPYEPDAS